MGRTLPDVLPERHFGESAETRRKSFTAGGASSREVRAEKTGRSVAPTRRLASLRAAVSPKSRLSVAQGETGCRRSPLKSGPKLNFEAASLKSSSESSRRSAETFSDGGKLAPGRSKFLSMARSFRAARETRGGSVEVSEQLRSFPATAGSSRQVARDFSHRREVSEQLARLAAGRLKFPSSSEVSRRRREARGGSCETFSIGGKFPSSSRSSRRVVRSFRAAPKFRGDGGKLASGRSKFPRSEHGEWGMPQASELVPR